MASAEPTQADIPPTTPDIDTQAKTETETESETETAKPSPDKVNDALTTLHTRLAQTLKDVDYNECFGVTLDPSDLSHGPTRMVLRKWLNSTNNDVDAALSNLTNTLKWRKEFKPLDCIHQTHPNKFDGLGYITRNLIQGQQAVVTWNIYAAAKDMGQVFGDIDAFLRWRVGLMERAMQELHLDQAADFDSSQPDPYQTYQIHDYLSISFFRMDASAKAASKKTVEIFSTHYPELLRRKLFVNVPYVMSWVYTGIKMLLPTKTTVKFMMLSNGEYLAAELGTKDVPKVYGGERDIKLEDEAIVLKSA